MTAGLHRRALCPTASADQINSIFQLRRRGGAIELRHLVLFSRPRRLAVTAVLRKHITAQIKYPERRRCNTAIILLAHAVK
jgi:hypothetical protein